MALDDRLGDLSSIDFKAASETRAIHIGVTRCIKLARLRARVTVRSRLLNVQHIPQSIIGSQGVHVFMIRS